MNHIAQPTTIPMTPPAPMAAAQPQADVISPNEAKFWAEQAQRAPALIQQEILTTKKSFLDKIQMGTMASIGFGSAMTVATFSKYTSGKWKLLTGAAAAASFVGSYMVSVMNRSFNATEQEFTAYANALATNPNLSNGLADFLSKTVTAENIQKVGLDKAVLHHAMEYATTTPLISNKQSVMMGLQSAARSDGMSR